jgi:hypothetical protein
MLRVRLLVGVAAVLALLAGVARTSSVLAQPNYSVSCTGNGPGLSDCTITLKSAIDIDSSFTVNLQNANGTIIWCNTLPSGGQCTFTNTSVTFDCTEGCAAGRQYRDVVQLSSGSGEGQTVSESNTLATVAPAVGANVIDLSQPSDLTSCTSTDIFVGITAGCSGIQTVDCQITSSGVSNVCSTSSTDCLAQTGAVYVNACGIEPAANSGPALTAAPPFTTLIPITIGSSQAANPGGCYGPETVLTSTGTTILQNC